MSDPRELLVRADSYLSLLWHRHVPSERKDSDLAFNVERTIGDLRTASKSPALRGIDPARLRSLVEQWRKLVSDRDGNTLWDAGYEEAAHDCADELAALLGEGQDQEPRPR